MPMKLSQSRVEVSFILSLIMGSVFNKMMLVTNPSLIWDYWDVSRSSNNVCVVNFRCRKVPGTTHLPMFQVAAAYKGFWFLRRKDLYLKKGEWLLKQCLF